MTTTIAVTWKGTVPISKNRDTMNYKHSLIKDDFQKNVMLVDGYKRSAYKIYEC